MDKLSRIKGTLFLMGVTAAISSACHWYWLLDEGSLEGWEGLVLVPLFGGIVVFVLLAGRCMDLLK